jgi:hypothetical protein
MNWREYEQRKAELRELNLTNQEYEQRIKEICEELEEEE